MKKEEALKRIAELVKRFEEQYDSYKSSACKEKQTRTDFIDPKNKKEKSLHDEIVKNVDQLLGLNKQLSETKLPSEQDQLKFRLGESATRIAYHDTRIDECVYELYRVTKEERKLVKET